MAKPKYRIDLNDGLLTVATKMSAGNPGAMTVLSRCINLGFDGLQYLLDLDDMGMSGAAIWLGFKEVGRPKHANHYRWKHCPRWLAFRGRIFLACNRL